MCVSVCVSMYVCGGGQIIHNYYKINIFQSIPRQEPHMCTELKLGSDSLQSTKVIMNVSHNNFTIVLPNTSINLPGVAMTISHP